MKEMLREDLLNSLYHLVQEKAVQREKAVDTVGEGWEMPLRIAQEVKDLGEHLVRRFGGEAREAGATWSEIAGVLGYATSSGAIRAVDPEVREAARVTSRMWAPVPPRKREPGFGASEAATIIGVGRRTIYDWIDRGKLQTIPGKAGQRIVGGHPEIDKAMEKMNELREQDDW